MPEETMLFFLKPDAVARRYVGARALARLLENDLRVVRFGTLAPSKQFLAEKHYGIHRGRFFYDWLVDYVSCAPVVALELAGQDAVTRVRDLLGATIPAQADPDSIRGRYGIDGGLNVAHASDSPENGRRELEWWGPLFDEAAGGDEEPVAAAHAYVRRRLDEPMIDPLRYRELLARFDGGHPPAGVESALCDLMRHESDAEEARLAALAKIMIRSATLRKPD